MEQLYEAEDRDGVRFTWNLWPSTNIDCKKLVTPLACMYSPFKPGPQIVQYEPVSCTTCHAYLNPYCPVDLGTKIWSCPFCFQRNKFPVSYDGISPENLPAELINTNTTIEYAPMHLSGGNLPAFLFVLDIYLHEEDLDSLKKTLIETLKNLPQNAFVGLITYGSTVNVYELSFPLCPKMHLFDGTKEWQPIEVQRILNIGAAAPGGAIQSSIKNKYIIPVSQAITTLSAVLEDIHTDPRPTKSEFRPQRAAGAAVSIALSLLEYTFLRQSARVLFLSGGPATIGPGLVVGEDLKEPLRSHSELNKETAKHVHKATKYYTTLAERAAKNGHAVDLFSCSLDQTGLLEMQELCKQTGGIIVIAETFQHEQFKLSLAKLFILDEKQHLNMGFNVRLEVKTSKEISLNGAIGHLTSAQNKSGNLSDLEIGIAKTCEWKTSAMLPSVCYSIFFETNNPKENVAPVGHGMMQFKTTYTHGSGQKVVRVTTVAHNWVPSNADPAAFLSGFDQEACAAVISRLVVYKAETEDADIIRWIDKHLILFCRRYAVFQKGNENSIIFPQEFGLYPQFMYYFRRCSITNVFGYSPDETVYSRYYLLHEPVANILMMLQPALDEYALGSDEPKPVLLSSLSLKKESILLLDTFFHVVIWSGTAIAQWRNAKYHEKEEYANLRDLMNAPEEDVKHLLKDRFPHPLFVVCDQGKSASRYLLATVDPSITSDAGLGGQQVINTEDASLQRFMEHLKKFTVQND